MFKNSVNFPNTHTTGSVHFCRVLHKTCLLIQSRCKGRRRTTNEEGKCREEKLLRSNKTKSYFEISW